jgi:nitroreductase / dihydropteridine reductase
MNDILQILQWRYATKRMTGKRIPDEKLETILDAIRMAPSSSGIQPYMITVIRDEQMRELIHKVACTQPQVLECSHLLVFSALMDINDSDIEEYISRISQIRNQTLDSLNKFRSNINELKLLSSEEFRHWASKQAYIALGFGLFAAAALQIDATPMEGFDPEIMDNVLKLKEKRYKSTVLMALGYRDPEKDRHVHLKKVRKPYNLLFNNI